MGVDADARRAGTDRPLASVVVPSLNGLRFLPQALESLAAQTWPQLEIIVVDGGSTDGTVDFLREWGRSHAIIWSSEPDRGQASAINRGFSIASGDFVAWLNADDLMEPDAARIAARHFESDADLDFLWGFCLVIDEDGHPLYVQNPFVRQDLSILLRHRNFVPQPGSWIRRSAFQALGPLDESLHYMFDYDYFLRVGKTRRSRFIPAIMARFRLHAGSKTGRHHREFLIEERRVFRRHGGRYLSPFFLDYLRATLIASPLDALKRPLRRVLWKVLGLSPGSRIRP